jgi:hypothetical protein
MLKIQWIKLAGLQKDLKVFLGIEGLWEIVCGDEDRPEAKAA